MRKLPESLAHPFVEWLRGFRSQKKDIKMSLKLQWLIGSFRVHEARDASATFTAGPARVLPRVLPRCWALGYEL